jgi:hypothetical protein
MITNIILLLAFALTLRIVIAAMMTPHKENAKKAYTLRLLKRMANHQVNYCFVCGVLIILIFAVTKHI